MYDVYYARSQNDNGEKETVEHHLHRVGELAGQFLDPIGYREWGLLLGETHDFGKYSPVFAEVLDHKRVHVNHAMPGAGLIYALYPKKRRSKKLLASVVASHHSALSLVSDQMMANIWSGNGERYDENGYLYSLYGAEQMSKACELWKRDFSRRKLPAAPEFSPEEDSCLARMLFLRILFSSLVDADYCSAAEHFQPDYLEKNTGRTFDAEEAQRNLQVLLDEKRSHSTADDKLNALRDQLFADCLSAAEGEPGLYTLTAPTGLGKTVSLFAFAARHAQIYRKRKIILVLPYLSLLDQNVRDYRRIVPDLLEIHSNAKLDERARLLSERWSAPCIVTTNISLLEPFFSADPTVCRHLHQLADTVIVLDEAQSLPIPLLYATLRTLKQLCERYRCTVVLSTATQPSYEFLKGLRWEPTEITKNTDRLFLQTRRVQYDWRIQKTIPLEQIAFEICSYRQVCVIVNLRRHARLLYQKLEDTCEKEELFYMTTDLCPAHRLEVMDEIRHRLAAGKTCRLIATQCIEAGVDLDFPILYRALAPLDSIIQAAGRCNRNGSDEDGRVVVFIPEDEGHIYPPGEFYEAGANCVKVLAERHPIDCSNRTHIREYYELLFSGVDGDKRELRQAIDLENFVTVEKEYRLIDNEGMNVIVPYSGKSELFRELREQLDENGMTRHLAKMASPITVSTYDRELVESYCEPLYYHSAEHGGESIPSGYYLLGKDDLYDDQIGLMKPPQESAIFYCV